jgi:FtsZ-binding cell division protein ZapB
VSPQSAPAALTTSIKSIPPELNAIVTAQMSFMGQNLINHNVELQLQLQSLQLENRMMKEKLSGSTDELRIELHTELNNQNKELLRQLATAQLSIGELSARNKILEDENSILKQQIMELKAENEALRKELAETKDRVQALEDAMGSLEREKKEMRVMIYTVEVCRLFEKTFLQYVYPDKREEELRTLKLFNLRRSELYPEEVNRLEKACIKFKIRERFGGWKNLMWYLRDFCKERNTAVHDVPETITIKELEVSIEDYCDMYAERFPKTTRKETREYKEIAHSLLQILQDEMRLGEQPFKRRSEEFDEGFC